MSQALASLTSAFTHTLQHEIDAGKRAASQPRGVTSLEQWCRIGMLVGWESLLSTYGKEAHMLGDSHGAIRSLMACGLCFVCRRDEGEGGASHGSQMDDGTAAAVSFALPPSPVCAVPTERGTSLATPRAVTAASPGAVAAAASVHEERASPQTTPTLLSAEARLPCGSPMPSYGRLPHSSPSHSSVSDCGGVARGGALRQPRVALHRDSTQQLVVQLWLPEELWAALPQEMRDGREVRCLVALISQGINAQQTVANAVGECELQALHTTSWRHTTPAPPACVAAPAPAPTTRSLACTLGYVPELVSITSMHAHTVRVPTVHIAGAYHPSMHNPCMIYYGHRRS